MEEKNIDDNLKTRVRGYLSYVHEKQRKQDEKKTQNILEKLSFALKNEILVQAFGRVLSKIPCFSENFSEEFLEKLSFYVKEKKLAPEEILIVIFFLFLC